MSAYVIVQINVTNNQNYKKYLDQVTPIVKRFQGEYIVRAGKYKVLLGNWDYSRTVIVKFQNYEAAINWYNSKEYEPIKKIREENSEGNCIIIEGC